MLICKDIMVNIGDCFMRGITAQRYHDTSKNENCIYVNKQRGSKQGTEDVDNAEHMLFQSHEKMNPCIDFLDFLAFHYSGDVTVEVDSLLPVPSLVPLE